MDLSIYTVEELKELDAGIKAELKARREKAKEELAAQKEENAEKFKGKLEAGMNVIFLFGTKRVRSTGVVKRVNANSVTIESASFKSGKAYVNYDKIVEILAEEADSDFDDVDDDVLNDIAQ